MSAPKLKNLTIVDEIKERIGKTNFVDVSNLVNTREAMTPEEVVEDQKNQIEIKDCGMSVRPGIFCRPESPLFPRSPESF